MQIVYLVGALIIALTLHEFAHALMADWLGDSTARALGRLTVNPIAHIDPFMTVLLPVMLILSGSPIVFGAAKPVPFNPHAVRYGKWGAALVALAGPTTNFILAIFFAAWIRLFHLGTGGFLAEVVVINIVLGIFNLIPFPPLDGSRVLYAAAPYPVREVMDRIERAGMIAIVVLIVVIFPFIRPWVVGAVEAITQLLLGPTLSI